MENAPSYLLAPRTVSGQYGDAAADIQVMVRYSRAVRWGQESFFSRAAGEKDCLVLATAKPAAAIETAYVQDNMEKARNFDRVISIYPFVPVKNRNTDINKIIYAWVIAFRGFTDLGFNCIPSFRVYLLKVYISFHILPQDVQNSNALLAIYLWK